MSTRKKADKTLAATTVDTASPAKTDVAPKKTTTKKASTKKVEVEAVAAAPVAPVVEEKVTVAPVIETPVAEPTPVSATETLDDTATFGNWGLPSRRQIARRAYALYRQGGESARENWMRAEKEVSRVMTRAAELFRRGSKDAFANWIQAEREVENENRV